MTMAAFNGKGVAATAHDAGSKLSTAQLAGRLRVATDYIAVTASADSGWTAKLCWIPFGATILDGYVTHGATNTATTCKIGIVGVSGTTYDNNDDLFVAASTVMATEAESRSAPKRLQLMKPVTDIVAAAPTPGYKVTDPAGAYIILTTAGAANGAAAAKFFALVEYVMD
jgi:hypothetical protein